MFDFWTDRAQDAETLQEGLAHDAGDQGNLFDGDEADLEGTEENPGQDAQSSLQEGSVHDADDFLIPSDDDRADSEDTDDYRAQDAEDLQEGSIHDPDDFLIFPDDDQAGPEDAEDSRNGGQLEIPKDTQKKGKKGKNKFDPTKPFKCPVSGCPKNTEGYPRADHQRRHMYEHLNIKPYKCQERYCSYECRRKDKITDHLVSKHKMARAGAAQNGANTSATAAIPEIKRYKSRIHIWVNTGVDPGDSDEAEVSDGADEADEAEAGDESGSEVAEHYRQDSVSVADNEDTGSDEEERRRLMDLRMNALEEASPGVSSDAERDYGEEPSSDFEEPQGGTKRKRSSDNSDDDELVGSRMRMT